MLLMRNGINGDVEFITEDIMTEAAMDIRIIPLLKEIMKQLDIPKESYLVMLSFDTVDDEKFYKYGNEELLNRPECDIDNAFSIAQGCWYEIFIEPEYKQRFLDRMSEIKWNREEE